VKILLIEAEMFHADGRTDGQTDMTVLIVAFRNFSKAPKIYVGFEVYAEKEVFSLLFVGIILLFN